MLSLYFKNLVKQKQGLNKFTDVVDICHLLKFDYFLFFCREVLKKQLIRQILTDSEKQVNVSLSSRWKHSAREQVQFLSHSLPALDGASLPGKFTSLTKPKTHWVGGCVGSRVSLGVLGKRKTYCICWVSNCKSSSPQSSHYTIWAMKISWYRNLIIF